MTTVAHILSGAYIGVIAAHVAPSETGYILVALASGAVLDLDHVYYIVKDWNYFRKNGPFGTLHRARSVFHELIGFTFVSVIMFTCSFVNLKLALVLGVPAMIHIMQDLIMGKSFPLAPFDVTEIHVIRQNLQLKIAVDILICAFFSFLWIRYLNVI